MDYMKALIIFISTMIVSAIVMYIFINPIVQDAYNKGYKRGIDEKCADLMEYIKEQNSAPDYLPFVSTNFSIG